MRLAVIIIFSFMTIWLTACAQRESAPANEPALTAPKPLFTTAITQTEPAHLISMTFFAKTPFNAALAKSCVQEQLPTLDNTDLGTHYLGRDVLTRSATLFYEARMLGILLSREHLSFQLMLLGQLDGTHYGFNQLGIIQPTKLNPNVPGSQPILANSKQAQRVTQALSVLFLQLDACMAHRTQ